MNDINDWKSVGFKICFPHVESVSVPIVETADVPENVQPKNFFSIFKL
jgi:hypothetical protein